MLIHSNHKPYMTYGKQEKKCVSNKNSGHLSLLFGMVGAFSICLISYNFFMQEKYKDILSSKGERRITRFLKEPALRGIITDRNGEVLAVSRHLNIAEFSPHNIYQDEKNHGRIDWNAISDEKFQKLAEILEEPVADVRSKLQNINSHYVRFKKELSLEEADAIRALKIPTLKFENRTERAYPMGNLFSHIIGFANNEGVGKEGLESSKDDILKGADGQQLVVNDVHRNVIGLIDNKENRAMKPGQNITLSLDHNMQKLAHDQLQAALKQFNAKAGGAVVLDAQTGEVLAMSSLPDYDANYFSRYPAAIRNQNFPVSVTIEPGSVIKPLIVAKAMNDGKINQNTWFDTSSYQIGDATIRDGHEYNSLNTEGIIQKSSNVGVSKIAAMYDNQELYNFLSSVGFGQKTKSGATGEQSMALKPANTWSRLDRAVISYGYTITANLLQLARGYTIFTTEGRLLPVSIFKQNGAPQGAPILKPEIAHQMREMMISVTQKGGTGQAGAVPGYDVAGKTGTARKAVNGRYEGKYRASFVGFAPAKNPRLIVAVSIDEPTGSYYGGTVAGPVFRGIMEGGLKLLNVAPTYLNTEQTMQTAQP